MSRSQKNSNFVNRYSAKSDRPQKKLWHGQLRAKQRSLINASSLDDQDIHSVTPKEISYENMLSKAGTHYLSDEQMLKKAKEIARRKAANDDELIAQVDRQLAKYAAK